MAPRIVVIGSSNMDLVVKTDHIPAPAETCFGHDFVVVPGGKGANQACAASRLGAQVDFVACVGTDAFGDQACAGLEAAGVCTSHVHRRSGTPTGVALIYVANDGQNCIVVAPGANLCLTAADVDSATNAIARADMVVVQCEVSMEATRHAIMVARRHGIPVLLNPAPATPGARDLLPAVSFVTPNEVEACALLGVPFTREFDPIEAATALRKAGAPAVIITLGDRGSVVMDNAAPQPVPPIAVEAVDATAAGDCYSAALAVALAEGRSLLEAARFATAAASISVTRLGAQPSLPARAEVDLYLASR